MRQTNRSSNLMIFKNNIYWSKQSFSGLKSQDFLHYLHEKYSIIQKQLLLLR